ncbi:hypothetical protein KY330_04370 [Candidatus Woesearchaeota archaeon]|nr:hypothetical protein [Candidatus Woesearchaeota archaeon]
MYYSNTSGLRTYSSLESSIYNTISKITPESEYMNNSFTERPSYQNIKQDYITEQRRPEQTDVIILKDSAFELFLRYSPLLKSLESGKVKDIYKDFLKKEGKHLLKFLKDKGRNFLDLQGFTRMKLDKNAIAAVIRSGFKAVLSININFDELVYDFARHNHLTLSEALTYVLAHETVHLADEVSEKRTEKLVGEFFQYRHQQTEQEHFIRLSKVAFRRSEEIK